jgi:hypothetical protein
MKGENEGSSFLARRRKGGGGGRRSAIEGNLYGEHLFIIAFGNNYQ